MGGLRVQSPLTPELDDLVHEIIGAAIEVHKQLGPGYVEKIYERALCHELRVRGIPAESQKEISVPYKDIQISGQQLDLLVAGKLILELKSVDHFLPLHEAQIMSYLKATGLQAGLLIALSCPQVSHWLCRLISPVHSSQALMVIEPSSGLWYLQ